MISGRRRKTSATTTTPAVRPGFAERHAPHRPHEGPPDKIDVRGLDPIVVSPTETASMVARGLI